ncbi:metal-dependent hydrolase [Marinobacter sp. SBS5]|uniref:metal-dependent hydrolase n=1 Tax=Marinobacter sp. SBS5 TaxID=3401754 RepID=UPI003AAF57D8
MATITASKASKINWPRFQKQQKGSSSRHSLTPRRVEFNWADTPLEWIPGQPFASHFINQINMILPAGEYWFCRLFNKALPHITDEKLREDVQAFIRQEAMHARAHGGAVEEYLQNHNIETARNTDFMDSLFKVALADNPFGQKIPKRLEKHWLVFRLGLVAAVEHMTCVLGMYALENKTWDDAGADEVLLDLLRWHGAEEVEHRCVAFDLYQHLGGSYVSRSYLALITFPLIFGIWADGAAHLMKQDSRFAKKQPSIFRPWIWREWSRTAKTGHLPSLTWLTLKELSFLSPLYNPSEEGSTELALNYLNGSPAYLATQQSEKKATAASA